jgi:hypothetical protein
LDIIHSLELFHTTLRKLDVFLLSGIWGGKVLTQLLPLEMGIFHYWANDPVGMFPPTHLMMEMGPVSEALCLKTLKKMDHVQNNGHVFCNTQSSETFRLSMYVFVLIHCA